MLDGPAKSVMRLIAAIMIAALSWSVVDAADPSKADAPADAEAVINRFEYEERPQRRRPEPVLLKYKLSPANAKPGETVVLSITIELDDDWHTFSLTQPDLGVTPTVISLDKLYGFESLETAFHADREPDIERPFGDLVLEIHRQQVTWTTPLKVLPSASPGGYGVSGNISYQLCNDSVCLTPRSQSFQVGAIAGQEPTQKQIVSTPLPSPRVITVVPPTRTQKRRFGSIFELIATAMTLGSTLILTPWLLSLVPAVVGYFAKRCESSHYRPLFPLFSFYGGLIGISTIFVAVTIVLTSELTSLELSDIASHPLLYFVISVAFLGMIAHLLGVIQWPTSGRLGDCVGAVLLSFGISIAILPTSLAYGSILLSEGLSVWSVAGLLAFLSGVAAAFFTTALVPYVLREFLARTDLPRAIRIVCSMWLLGCFANSAHVTAALMNPTLLEVTPIANWTSPSRTDLGITCFLDFDRATRIAGHKQQPLLLVFGAINDVNSRLMEIKLTKPENLARIEKYSCAQLFIDRVPRIKDKVEQKRIVERNWSLLVEMSQSVVTPTLIVVTPDGKTVLASYVGLEQNEGEVAAFLDESWLKWQASRTGRVPVAD